MDEAKDFKFILYVYKSSGALDKIMKIRLVGTWPGLRNLFFKFLDPL